MALAMPAQQACKEKYKWPWQCQHNKLARRNTNGPGNASTTSLQGSSWEKSPGNKAMASKAHVSHGK